MTAEGPTLVGTKGVAEGEVFALKYGHSMVIGRSRSCDISLRKCPRWLEAEGEGEAPGEAANTVSRKHLKLTYHDPNSIELEDLSSNGTFVDGRRIDRLVLTDVQESSHEIVLGGGETFRIEWR
ncbi:MAG: FHA domain-containing protein [Planctomycetota bacterium]